MSWHEEVIENLFKDSLRNGIYKTKEFQGSGIRIVNMKELFAYDFINSQSMRLIELDQSEFEKFTLQKGDLLFGRRSLVEEGAGKCSIVKEISDSMCFESSIIRMRLNEKIADPLFFYYYFKSFVGRTKIKSIVTGLNVKGIKGSDLKKLKVELPYIKAQRRIASILSAYDDLIENNLKRIKLLEEAAQNIYREWFVHFRFPGHENTTIGEDGLPEGWRRSTIYDEVDVMSGGTPKTGEDSFWNGEIPFFTPKDASNSPHLYINQSEKMLTEEGLARCNSKLYPKDTVFITARGTVGKIKLAMTPMAMNQSCYALKARGFSSQLYLLFSMLNVVDHIQKNATGGVFDTIIVDTFKQIEIVIPNDNLIQAFTELVSPIIHQTSLLIRSNDLLQEGRDILLPRLMNQNIAL